MNGRLIQIIALTIAVACTATCGAMLGPILRMSDEAGLRYTDVSVEGAPPFVALGTAIGALRGLIVDYLWIKVNFMKEEGLFYEVMADADLITKLQPRFAAVWAFHGHNMAYNISVACQTEQERWAWVNAGIRLVRNKGLRYNPNDLDLHKELAFWFSHKIEGYSDDANLYYKREFCREWHFVLGPPPVDQEARIAWIKAIADAPATVEEAERRAPGVKALIERLNANLSPFGEDRRFQANRAFLEQYGWWKAITEQSEAAKILGVEQRERAADSFFLAFDRIAADPKAEAPLAMLVAYVRKRVLLDEYNMDPEIMYEFTRDLGPIDWRSGYAHALYWSRKGSMLGEARVADENDIYKIVNNDRMQIQAMQGLARYGRITFDPFSTELPTRFPDPRWIDTIIATFDGLYTKHYGTRGAGGDTFIGFLENFLGSEIREAFRSGERDRAQRLLDVLDAKFGRGAVPPNNKYRLDLDIFVKNQVKGEYSFQPHLAPSEAVASLRYAFRVGVGRDRPEVYRQALHFVDLVIKYFRGNESNDYVNRYGEGRMKNLLADLEVTRQKAFLQLMIDPSVPMRERATIWAKVDKFEPKLRVQVYDVVAPRLQRQFAAHELSRSVGFDALFPKPPGLELFRQKVAAEQARRQAAEEQARRRDTLERTDERR